MLAKTTSACWVPMMVSMLVRVPEPPVERLMPHPLAMPCPPYELRLMASALVA